jgi:hypothetical protein
MNNVERLDRLEEAVAGLIDMVIDLRDPTLTAARRNGDKRARLLEIRGALVLERWAR